MRKRNKLQRYWGRLKVIAVLYCVYVICTNAWSHMDDHPLPFMANSIVDFSLLDLPDPAGQDEKSDETQTAIAPPNLTAIPGDNIHTSGQAQKAGFGPWLHDMEKEVVIRLDLEMKAQGVLSVIDEETICGSSIQFYTFNVDYYQEGSVEWRKMMNEIKSLVKKFGNVLIHCLHGEHRAKMVAGWIMATDGYSWDQIVAILDWYDLVDRPGEYSEYVYAVWDEVQLNSN